MPIGGRRFRSRFCDRKKYDMRLSPIDCQSIRVTLQLSAPIGGAASELTQTMRHIQHAAHIVIFALTVHVWHIVTSDRMLDAAADVGLDKVATFAIRVANVMPKGE